MNIDEAIEILKGIKYASHTPYFKNFELTYQDVDAIETLINGYSNLKQIEEEHRIENGELRKELEQEKEKNKELQLKNVELKQKQIIAIPLEEYKELLIIKGKYEEYSNSRLQIKWDGYKEDGTTITTDPLIMPPYKVTCDCSKHIPLVD